MGESPIIVAVDPDREDTGAAALGLLLARITGSPLLLVSVEPHDRGDDALLRLSALRGQLAERTGAAVEVSSTLVTADGSPAGAIQRLAQRRQATSIVVGSSARGPIGRVAPGAVTDRVLHGAPCPVAVAPPGFSAEQIRLIGVAFVERADGRAALACANELARASGALVRVLTVREPVDWRFTGPLAAAQLVALERAHDVGVQRVASAGGDAVPARRAGGTEILYGAPDKALAAASADLDLLVCGSRGYGPARTLLLGGVSHALVREAACPVLVVPLADDERVAA